MAWEIYVQNACKTLVRKLEKKRPLRKPSVQMEGKCTQKLKYLCIDGLASIRQDYDSSVGLYQYCDMAGN